MAPKRRQAKKPATLAEEPAPAEPEPAQAEPQQPDAPQQTDVPAESRPLDKKKPTGRGRKAASRPAPAKPEGVTKRTRARQPVSKEVPKEDEDAAVPKPSRSRRPAAAPAVKKPAARARAPTTKRAAQKEQDEEKQQPAKKAVAPRRRTTGAAASKKAATPKKAAAPRKRAAPAARKAPAAAPSRRRGAAAKKKQEEGKEEEEEEEEQGKEVKEPARKRAARAPVARGGRRGKAATPKADAEGTPSEGEQPPTRPTGRGEVAEKRGTRKPAAEPVADKPRRPAPKRKAQETEHPADLGAPPSPEAKAEEEGVRPAKRQRLAKVPKGAAPSAESAAMHMLAKKPPADVFVWGSNPFGGLGLGEDETLKFRPTQVHVPGVQFVEVVCGGMHTVALSTTGEVWTWGVNDEGALGRKTLGTAWEAYPDEEKADEKVPGRAVLPEGVRMVELAAGDGFTVALAPDGSVYGCGTFKDDVGGLSGFTDTAKVQSLMALLYSPKHAQDEAIKLVAGARHCVILTKNGTVLTWGIGSQGQLGRLPAFDSNSTPTAADLFVPKPVPTAAIGIRPTSIATIAAGAYSTFVISKSGDVMAWGLNNSCQLGIDKGDEQNNLLWEPTKVPSINKVHAIKGGEQHTLILSKEGKLYSCGAPTYGMLGREGIDVSNANDKYFEPKPVHGFDQPPDKGKAVRHLEAGTNISACTQEDGSAWLWGSQVNYQLAKGDTEEDALVPEKLKRTKTFGFRKIYTISFGGQHAALLAGPQEEAPPPPAPAAAPAPAPAAPPPTEDGAGPSGVPAPPAADAGAAMAAELAATTVSAVAAAAPATSAPPSSVPAPSEAPTEAGVHAQAEVPNPSQSAVDAAMAWAQQMVAQGGLAGHAGGAGGMGGAPVPSITAPAEQQPEQQPGQQEQQQQEQQEQEQEQRPFLEGGKEERGEALMQEGEGGAGGTEKQAEAGNAQQEAQQQQQQQQGGAFLEGAVAEERAEAILEEGEGGPM